MRLGVNIDFGHKDPESWSEMVRELGVSAVIAPMHEDDSPEVIKRYMKLIKENNLVVGEVGVWNNTISSDETARKEAVAYAKRRLALADEIGANCCVNIAGSCHDEKWFAYSPKNYTADTYALIVDTTREILDSVKPKRTFYSLEAMPWVVPDSPDSYLKLLEDVDRPGMAVHLDCVNMINGIDRFNHRKDFVEECFRKLGPKVRSIHAKDLSISEVDQPCHLSECDPGQGAMDFAQVLRLAEGLGPDTTVFVEHMLQPEQYVAALKYVRAIGQANGIYIK